LFILAQLHFGDSLGKGHFFVFDFGQRPGWEGFVFDVEARELLAGGGEGLEVGGEGDARKLALEIGGVAGAVGESLINDPLGDPSALSISWNAAFLSLF
jgi:hypothetical protein